MRPAQALRVARPEAELHLSAGGLLPADTGCAADLAGTAGLAARRGSDPAVWRGAGDGIPGERRLNKETHVCASLHNISTIYRVKLLGLTRAGELWYHILRSWRRAMDCDVTRHYDLLAEEGNDPVLDPPALQEHMDRWDGPRFIGFLRAHLAGSPDASVLEIGVGTGRLARQVCAFCGDFTGIDLSAKSIDAARGHLGRDAALICGDFLAHDFSRQFDAVYSSLTWLHIADKAAAARKVAALLRPGGLFLLSLDKAREDVLDFGTRRVRTYPDDPAQTEALLRAAGFAVAQRWESEEAVVFAAKKLPAVIHILGASGSGTTTLGRALEARFGYKQLDTDGYAWAPTDPPYQQLLPREERIAPMRAMMERHPRCVVSGSLCGWGDVFIPKFELVVWLQTPTEVRLERLRRREQRNFGARVLPGGDMYENHENFLAYAAQYDTGDERVRSFALHEKWVRGLGCPVMVLDGTRPVEELMALVCGG